MSLVEEILFVLGDYYKGYSLMRLRMQGDTRAISEIFKKKSSKQVVSTTLYRLKKKGLIDLNDGKWGVTQEGRNHVDRQLIRESLRTKEKSIVISFDIPERHKSKRRWLRAELRGLGFEMLQKSLWFGPAPFPKDFIGALNELKLIQYLKFFGAKEKDII